MSSKGPRGQGLLQEGRASARVAERSRLRPHRRWAEAPLCPSAGMSLGSGLGAAFPPPRLSASSSSSLISCAEAIATFETIFYSLFLKSEVPG